MKEFEFMSNLNISLYFQTILSKRFLQPQYKNKITNHPRSTFGETDARDTRRQRHHQMS